MVQYCCLSYPACYSLFSRHHLIHSFIADTVILLFRAPRSLFCYFFPLLFPLIFIILGINFTNIITHQFQVGVVGFVLKIFVHNKIMIFVIAHYSHLRLPYFLSISSIYVRSTSVIQEHYTFVDEDAKLFPRTRKSTFPSQRDQEFNEIWAQ